MKIEVDANLGYAAIALAIFVGVSIVFVADGLQTFLKNSSVKYEVAK